MPTKIIAAFFTLAGTPQTTINPTISIYSLDSTTPATVTSGAVMTTVGGGWYQYYFDSWDHDTRYVIVCDGTATITYADERYLARSLPSTPLHDQVSVVKPDFLRNIPTLRV